MLSRPPDRRKRHKLRAAAGVACCTVEFDASIVEMLVRLRWLPPKESFNREEIGEALGRQAKDTAKRLLE
jgi:hypothetical protein